MSPLSMQHVGSVKTETVVAVEDVEVVVLLDSALARRLTSV